MDSYIATIREGDTRLLKGVTVHVEEVQKPFGLRTWYGSFELAAGQNIEPGGPYRIELDDGRSGNILITEIVLSGAGRTQVSFQGTGPLC